MSKRETAHTEDGAFKRAIKIRKDKPSEREAPTTEALGILQEIQRLLKEASSDGVIIRDLERFNISESQINIFCQIEGEDPPDKNERLLNIAEGDYLFMDMIGTLAGYLARTSGDEEHFEYLLPWHDFIHFADCALERAQCQLRLKQHVDQNTLISLKKMAGQIGRTPSELRGIVRNIRMELDKPLNEFIEKERDRIAVLLLIKAARPGADRSAINIFKDYRGRLENILKSSNKDTTASKTLFRLLESEGDSERIARPRSETAKAIIDVLNEHDLDPRNSEEKKLFVELFNWAGDDMNSETQNNVKDSYLDNPNMIAAKKLSRPIRIIFFSFLILCIGVIGFIFGFNKAISIIASSIAFLEIIKQVYLILFPRSSKPLPDKESNLSLNNNESKELYNSKTDVISAPLLVPEFVIYRRENNPLLFEIKVDLWNLCDPGAKSFKFDVSFYSNNVLIDPDAEKNGQKRKNEVTPHDHSGYVTFSCQSTDPLNPPIYKKKHPRLMDLYISKAGYDSWPEEPVKVIWRADAEGIKSREYEFVISKKMLMEIEKDRLLHSFRPSRKHREHTEEECRGPLTPLIPLPDGVEIPE